MAAPYLISSYIFCVDIDSLSEEEADSQPNEQVALESDNNLQEVKQLLRILCKKVDGNEKSLKELQSSK